MAESSNLLQLRWTLTAGPFTTADLPLPPVRFRFFFIYLFCTGGTGRRLKGICDLIITASPHLVDPSAFIFLSDPVSLALSLSTCHFSLCSALFPHPSLNQSPSSQLPSLCRCISAGGDSTLSEEGDRRPGSLKTIRQCLRLIRQLFNGSEFGSSHYYFIIGSLCPWCWWGRSILSGSGIHFWITHMKRSTSYRSTCFILTQPCVPCSTSVMFSQ